MRRRLAGLLLVLVAALVLLYTQRQTVTWLVIEQLDPDYDANAGTVTTEPEFSGADATRPQIPIRLVEVAWGFTQITDIQPVPGPGNRIVVLEKEGRAYLVNLDTRERDTLVDIQVRKASEQGLLGLAFHPRFAEDPRFFLNYVTQRDGQDITRIEAWTANPETLREAHSLGVVLEQAQPYQNHNAGQIAFGPDGMLYVGFGDGGAAQDPHDHGQEPLGWLGSMLRIDVSGPKGYAVPKDNPFVGKAGIAPETFAIGLRNPWRYSFAPDGRLIIGDVGQGAYEEVSIALAGDNLGWRLREGRHCGVPDKGCTDQGFRDPIYEYGRQEGASITGGYVYTGTYAALSGLYVFGDFVTGRLWAIALPAPGTEGQGPLAPVSALGRWPINPSSFGRAPDGGLLVGDFAKGVVYRIEGP